MLCEQAGAMEKHERNFLSGPEVPNYLCALLIGKSRAGFFCPYSGFTEHQKLQK